MYSVSGCGHISYAALARSDTAATGQTTRLGVCFSTILRALRRLSETGFWRLRNGNLYNAEFSCSRKPLENCSEYRTTSIRAPADLLPPPPSPAPSMPAHIALVNRLFYAHPSASHIMPATRTPSVHRRVFTFTKHAHLITHISVLQPIALHNEFVILRPCAFLFCESRRVMAVSKMAHFRFN